MPVRNLGAVTLHVSCSKTVEIKSKQSTVHESCDYLRHKLFIGHAGSSGDSVDGWDATGLLGQQSRMQSIDKEIL